MDYVGGHLDASLEQLFAGCDQALRHTRGVAMGVVVADLDARTATHAGIGNTRAVLVSRSTSTEVRLTSNPGIVGGGYKRLSPQSLTVEAGDLLLLYTDGVPEFIDLDHLGDALRSDVQALADRILQEWALETDDAGVLVLRFEDVT